MDESEAPSWKGHSFTLLVFAGIVVLCSIFFVLGMLVGRSQGQRIAEMAAADEGTRKNVGQPLPDQPLDYFKQSTEETPDNALLPPPTPPTTAEAPGTEPDPPQVREPDKPYLQILATKDPKEAEREQAKVQLKGFRAIIFPPKPGDKDALYRVQVGPYETNAEATIAIKELQSQGYKDVFRK